MMCYQVFRFRAYYFEDNIFLFFMNKEEIWQAVLAQIQLSISPANFATWFKNTSVISYKDGQVIISVPNSFAKEWLENKYGDLILEKIAMVDIIK